jgi:hypothetical protein
MMNQNDLNEKCHQWLKTLCVDINERNTGSQGNRDATRFFREQLESLGWETEIQEFTKNSGHMLFVLNLELHDLVEILENLLISDLENAGF